MTGLLGMEERATLLGGNLIIELSPGAGTQLSAQFPKKQRVRQADQESAEDTA